jgi:hypothetical protein
MKKRLTILALCSVLLASAWGQEKYSVVLERSKQLSPYEAIYLLMDYQYWHPEYSNIYYQLGNLSYDLLPTRDPLHHYQELSTLLYQSRLFYGNCLHFAKDQKLQGWQYAELANGQKRIEYEVLEQYVRPRLEEVKRQQTACDSIHRSFVRMSERYNRCQALFTGFLTRYTREKTAHLRLQPEERKLLLALKQTADSLEGDIAAYRSALALQPVKGYEPVFRKEEIILYRLDGLTYTDFLQNDIALWDYSGWVKRFMDEQRDVYERLYADLDQELDQLLSQVKRYDAGRPVSGVTDLSLIGRCERLGLQNTRVDSVRMLQQTVRNAMAEQTIVKSTPPQTIREMIPLLQVAAERRDAAPDSALKRMNAHLIKLAEPLRIQQQATYVSPISGETVHYTPMPGEQVHCLLPADKGYRCVVTDEAGTLGVIALNANTYFVRREKQIAGEQPLLFTRIPGNLWALITDKNVYFIP